MRNVGIVIKHEILTILGTRSFWVMTFLFPLIMLAFTVIPQALARSAFERVGRGIVAEPGAARKATGYVDQAGIIKQLPPDLPTGQFRVFGDDAAARASLAAGDLDHYYLITPNFMETGDVVLVGQQFLPMAGPVDTRLLEKAIYYNLVDNEGLAALIVDPMPSVQERSLAPQLARRGPRESMQELAVPLAAMFILFFIITISAGFMLQSVTREKQSRTAEVLLLSLRPRDLMLGKLVGLGAVALLQMSVWMAGGLLSLGWGGGILAVVRMGVSVAGQPPELASLPAGFVLWALLYFLLGYVLYASALGAVGALAPSMREGSQIAFVILLPLLMPVSLGVLMIESPDGALATILSLFPLTAPTSMVTRLAAGAVPAWQLAAGLLLLAATTYLFVLLSARFFRAENLVSEANLDWRRLWHALGR